VAARAGIPLDLIWVHINLTHQRIAQLLAQAEIEIGERIPGATLSVNRNISNTQALVKITATGAEFNGALPGNVRTAIIRIYTEADHAEALTMTTTEAWAGPPVVD
jgi:hypothetical protein